jgi:hypothetical protein
MDGTVDVGAVERPGRDRRHGFWTERAEGGHGGQKHIGVRHTGPLVCRIGEEGLAHLLGQREPRGAPILPRHAECAIVPIAIAPWQRRDITRAQP